MFLNINFISRFLFSCGKHNHSLAESASFNAARLNTRIEATTPTIPHKTKTLVVRRGLRSIIRPIGTESLLINKTQHQSAMKSIKKTNILFLSIANKVISFPKNFF
jgi:hypothetical protein